MDLVAQPPLTEDEDALLGHYRRLKRHHKDWTLTIKGRFRSGRQQILVAPCPELALQTGLTEDEFDALD